jgi:Growth-Arrest-Specific Protein 2 Domain
MEDRKLYELRFELKEISGIPPVQTNCLVEIADTKENIPGKGQVIISLFEVAANTTLSIALSTPDKTLGITKISMGTLFGDSLSGKVDRWFKLKSEEYENLKLKIVANLVKLDKLKPKPAVPSRKSSKNLKEIKCPYLEKLALGKETNTEPLNDIWKYRESNMNNFIKISLEPDSPTRLEADQSEFTLPHIEDISIDSIHNMSGSQLKQIVRKLCEETKSLTTVAQRFPEIRDQMNKKISERRELELSSQQEMESIKEKWMKKHEKLLELQESRKTVKEALIDKQDQARKLEGELDILKAQLGDYKRENIVLSAQRLQYDDCKKVLAELEKINQESIKKKSELQEKIDKSQSDLAEAHSKAVKDNETIRKERDEAKVKIEEVNKELKSTLETNEKLKQKLLALKSKASDHSELKNQAKISSAAYQAESSKRDEINSKLDQLTTELEKQSNEIYTKQQDLISAKRVSISKVSEFEKSIEKKEQEILETRKKLLEASTSKIAQEQICCIRADLDQLIVDLSNLKKFYQDSRLVMFKNLEAGSKILIDESEKIYLQAEKLDQMIDAVDKKDEEIDGLKTSVGEVKKRNPQYFPAKDDAIDIALSEYLNNKEAPVPIKFLRQGAGNYLFGSKKIYIKIETGRLLVRVGGGFTSIDEFLNIYTPVELEKSVSREGSPRLTSLSKGSRDSSPSSLIGRLSISESSRSPRRV